jgi:hypothetical protein
VTPGADEEMRPPPVVIERPQYFWRLHWRLRERLPMWVIYRPVTGEYPGLWVARMHLTLPDAKPTRFVITHPTLAGLRELLPPDVTRLRRHPDDVAEIEEAWL